MYKRLVKSQHIHTMANSSDITKKASKLTDMETLLQLIVGKKCLII